MPQAGLSQAFGLDGGSAAIRHSDFGFDSSSGPSDFVIFPSLPALLFLAKIDAKKGKNPQKTAKNCKKVQIRACPS